MRLVKKPRPVVPDDICTVLLEHWHLRVAPSSVKQIDSYDDANFYCESSGGVDAQGPAPRRWLVKFYNALEAEQPDLLHGLAEMLSAIRHSLPADEVQVPTILAPPAAESGSNSGADTVVLENCPVQQEDLHCAVAVRVFKWIDGTTLSRCSANAEILEAVGSSVAAVHTALHGFDHPSFHRQHLWDLKQLHLSQPLLQEPAVQQMLDGPTRECIAAVFALYEAVVIPAARSEQLPQAVIMGDCNDANVIVWERDGAAGEAERVVGLIDFSDAVHTWRVNEVAIAMAYALITSFGQQSQNRHTAMAAVLAGYTRRCASSGAAAQLRVTAMELRCLPVLVAVRLCISVLVGAYAISREPENEYLKLHAVPGREAIRFLCGSGGHASAAFESHSRFLEAAYAAASSSAGNVPFEELRRIIYSDA